MRKGVFLSEAGSTPRKEQRFNISSPPMNISRASPDREGYIGNSVLKSTPQRNQAQERRRSLQDYDESEEIDARPTTSRKIPNPSPDKFTSYIVPSPTKEKGNSVWNVADNVETGTGYDSEEYYSYEALNGQFNLSSQNRRNRADSNLSSDAAEYEPNSQNRKRADSNLSADASEFKPNSQNRRNRADSNLSADAAEWIPEEVLEYDPLAQPSKVPHEIGRFMLFVALAS